MARAATKLSVGSDESAALLFGRWRPFEDLGRKVAGGSSMSTAMSGALDAPNTVPAPGTAKPSVPAIKRRPRSSTVWWNA